MPDAAWLAWLELLVRWLHFIVGIAWIGASFYFVWLDNHLLPPAREEDTERGVHGEVWSVHGGGFYRNEKYLLGPRGEPLTERLHWFKWEAYWTFLSGALLLALVYWVGASVYLIDPAVRPLSVPAAIALSAGALLAGWLVYDGLCRAIDDDRVLGVAIAAFFVAADWALFQVFSARAAYLHVGAMLGTCMVANVRFVIIPGQRRTVAALRAGREPDPRPGRDAKRRSVHNTYFTLPVLFVMISNHYPATYQHPVGWGLLVVIALAGVLIRAYFVRRHGGRNDWWLALAAAVLLLGLGLALQPAARDRAAATEPVSLAQVQAVLHTHCRSCHAARPTHPSFPAAPAGAIFETPAQIEAHAGQIHQRSVVTRDMPLGNATAMTDAERDLIARWYAERK